MKTKLEMAHEWAMKIIEGNMRAADASDLIERAWAYADAMQAEADKRTTEVIVSYASKEFHNKLEVLCKKEWQPDWSQAPEWAIAWTFDRNETLWWSEIPEIHRNFWFIDGGIWKCAEAPSFGYTGDWRNSLRKRPQ